MTARKTADAAAKLMSGDLPESVFANAKQKWREMSNARASAITARKKRRAAAAKNECLAKTAAAMQAIANMTPAERDAAAERARVRIFGKNNPDGDGE